MTEEQKTALYADYREKVFGYLLGKVGNRDLAEDLCSDVFLKIYEKLDSFDETKASLSTWVFTVMRNTLIDYYRTRKVTEEVPEELSADFSVEEEVCQSEELELLAKALETLPERERDLIILHYYSGVSLKEIALRMGISYTYVKVLHNKALTALKKRMETGESRCVPFPGALV